MQQVFRIHALSRFRQTACFLSLIFYGEKIPYYIKEEKDGTWTVTESGQVQNQELCTHAEGSRYDLVNDMMVSRQMEDEITLMERLETYGRLDGLVREEFALMENTHLFTALAPFAGRAIRNAFLKNTNRRSSA